MAAIPRSAVDGFSRALDSLSDAAREKLEKRLAEIDYSDMTRAIDEAVALMQAFCALYADASASVAGRFYEVARDIVLGGDYAAVAESKRVPEATEKAVRAMAQAAVEGNSESFASQLLSRLDYEVKRAAGECIISNVRRDPKKPRFARVPSGSETCQFCMMLASRGFVYSSKTSAGVLNHYHANCDCRIVPQWGDSSIEGYDPGAWYDAWRGSVDAEARARSERNGTAFEDERTKIMSAYSDSSKRARERARM